MGYGTVSYPPLPQRYTITFRAPSLLGLRLVNTVSLGNTQLHPFFLRRWAVHSILQFVVMCWGCELALQNHRLDYFPFFSEVYSSLPLGIESDRSNSCYITIITAGSSRSRVSYMQFKSSGCSTLVDCGSYIARYYSQKVAWNMETISQRFEHIAELKTFIISSVTWGTTHRQWRLCTLVSPTAWTASSIISYHSSKTVLFW